MTHRSLLRPALGLLLTAVVQLTNAQVATFYTPAFGTRPWTPITGGQAIATGTFDDAVYQVTVPAICFQGVFYTELRVSTNGFITVGGALPGATSYLPISGSGAYTGAIAPFAANLKNATTGTATWFSSTAA